MLTFLRYAAGVIVRPGPTFHRLLADPRRVGIGFGGLLALWLAYFASFSLAFARDREYQPSNRLVLRIPAERYYRYERFFILPVALGETILTAGVIRLLARAWHGRGRFEDLFALLGLSHVTIVLSMTVPDTVAIFYPRLRGAPPYTVGGSLWMLALLVRAIEEAEGLPLGRSMAVAVPAALANAAVEYVFIR